MNIKRDPIYLDWTDNHMVCTHCNTRTPLKIPIAFTEAVKTMDEFRQEHEPCKPKAND